MTPVHPLTLHLHDGARVLAADGRALPLRGRAAGLVALAALEQGVSRERAAQLLWPDASNPRQSLRQQLLRFRQALGTPLLEGEHTLALAPDVQLVAAAPGAQLLADEEARDDAFGHWLLQHRQREQQALLAPLRQALVRAEQAGDLDQALDHARALLAHDGGDEEHHAGLMRVHYLRGEAAAGLAVYERLAQHLRTEWDAEPARATRELAQALRLAKPSPAARDLAAAAQPLMLARPPRLAGRQAELHAVHQAWREGRVVLLQGEAGMGKSRLIAELLAAEPDASVRCAAAGRPGDSAAPYATLSRWLQPLLATHLGALPASFQQVLHRLQPSAPSQGVEPLAPRALPQAVAALLEAAGPDLCVLDDLHFADDATLELLAGQVCDTGPVRWLLAQRPAEAGGAAQRLADALAEQQRLALVTLDPLDEAATAAMLDTLAIDGLQGAALAGPLWRHTGGNPLFMLETLKLGLADGSLQRGELPRPAGVGTLIERRLQRLGEGALALARVAALAGVDFGIELAEAVSGQRALQLASAWAELEQAQLLRDGALAHDLVADAVRRGVPAVVARRVHAAVAAWLVQQGAPPARVAEQHAAAGDGAAAALQWVAAARIAHGQGRATEAAALLDRALAQPQWADAGAHADTARLRCEVLWDVDLGERLDRAVADALALARTPAQRAEALFAQVNGLYFRTDFAAALAAAPAAAAAAEQAGQPATLLALRLTEARALARSGGVARALALARSAQPLLQGLPPVHHFEFHGILGVLLLQAARVPEARVELQAALALADTVQRPLDVPNLVGNIASCDQISGYAERALQGQHEVLQRAAGQAQGVTIQYVEMNIATALLDMNRYAEAWPWIERCGQALAAQSPAYLPMAGTLLARWYLELGQPARANKAFADFALAADTPPFVRAYRAIVQAQVLSATGGGAAAVQAAVADALQAASAAGRPNLAWEARLMAHALACGQGAGDLAELATTAQSMGFEAHAAVALTLMGQPQAAAPLLDPGSGLSPRWFYRGRLWTPGPAARLWLEAVCEQQVPREFRESFLHRQPVNQPLLRALPSA